MKGETVHKPVTVTRGALLYAIVAILLVNVTVTVIGIVYTNTQQRDSDRKWCQLLSDLDRPVDPRVTDPRQRERTIRTVERIHKLRVDFGCIS